MIILGRIAKEGSSDYATDFAFEGIQGGEESAG